MFQCKGAVAIDERPSIVHCILMGIQHVLAMFGSTVLGNFLKKKCCTIIFVY
jgi:xanthine/uracil permease